MNLDLSIPQVCSALGKIPPPILICNFFFWGKKKNVGKEAYSKRRPKSRMFWF